MEKDTAALAKEMGFLTEEQVALLAKVKVETLDEWRRRGKGPDYVRFGTAVFYDISDIKAHLLSIKKTVGCGREAMLRSI
ncbi:helix-turn-helix transcriptional regulator [Stutzerimonas kunmingensis]|uniref:Helix-turn-helix domain-containing protein n=1 Tax=Stutzerimonas kunmingensis TaxID=1211807 RepID=A0A9X1N400_9GAMM|nr:helix-turn-helix domain-containing protein [Stutzerimonas kunmingensis]MCD1608598.1 helix-turn-helix domain-containing protein [Stutzerimonas kunmingensis]